MCRFLALIDLVRPVDTGREVKEDQPKEQSKRKHRQETENRVFGRKFLVMRALAN
jgi:hypothetical protein